MKLAALGGGVRLERLVSAEGALILGGLGIAAAGAAIDVWAIVTGLATAGQGAHDSLLSFNLPFLGLAFIAFGLLMAQPSLFLRKGFRRVFLASLLLIADGLLHMSLIAAHLEELHQAVFFGAIAGVQIFAGLTLPESSRRLRDVWILLTLGLVALYAVSRTTAVPILFDLEGVENLGVVSKVLEVLLILVLLSMRAPAFDARLRAAAAATERTGEAAVSASR